MAPSSPGWTTSPRYDVFLRQYVRILLLYRAGDGGVLLVTMLFVVRCCCFCWRCFLFCGGGAAACVCCLFVCLLFVAVVVIVGGVGVVGVVVVCVKCCCCVVGVAGAVDRRCSTGRQRSTLLSSCQYHTGDACLVAPVALPSWRTYVASPKGRFQPLHSQASPQHIGQSAIIVSCGSAFAREWK